MLPGCRLCKRALLAVMCRNGGTGAMLTNPDESLCEYILDYLEVVSIDFVCRFSPIKKPSLEKAASPDRQQG